MNRLQITALFGLLALTACSAADDVGERPLPDAGRDARTVPRSDAPDADRLDASGGTYADEASTTPDPDVDLPDTSSPPDVTVPPVDGAAPPDGLPPIDGASPPDGVPNDIPPPPMDAAPDQIVTSCLVTFTVGGVRWDAPEGGADAQVAGRVVRLVGDAANLGSWAPTAGVLLTETTPGTWSGTATFRDQQLTEFKFVKLEGVTPEWENWLPYDSNRSLRVECFEDGGVLRDAADAAADHDAITATDSSADKALDGDALDGDAIPATDVSGDTGSSDGSIDGVAVDATADVPESGAPDDGRVVAVPARGRTYLGVFGIRPTDATK